MVGKIKNKEEIAEGTLMVTFQLKEPVNFKSGQYIIVTLPHLNYPDERGLKRLFSTVNDPSDNKRIQIATRITESGFKKTLNELPVDTQNAQNYMVVGPPGMVEAVEQALLEAGVSQENIKTENFTGY